MLRVANSPRRLLVRSTNWLGDAVMTTPALMRLREALPAAHISLLTSEKLAGLWENQSVVDDVLTFTKDESVLALGRRLRQGRFDTALLFPNSARSALEVWWAGIPRRIGMAGNWRSGLLTQSLHHTADVSLLRKSSSAEARLRAQGSIPPSSPPRPGSHQMFHYLRIASVLGAQVGALAPQIQVPESRQESVRQKFGMIQDSSWIGINPGAEYGPAKRWPEERFLELCRNLLDRPKVSLVLLGGFGDRETTGRIANSLGSSSILSGRIRNVAGETSLSELCAVLKLCRVVVTNDTGPMHVAAAVGTPVVVPFGSTSPDLTGPGLPSDIRNRLIRGTADCAPCFLRECPIDFRCMHSIGVARILEAVQQML